MAQIINIEEYYISTDNNLGINIIIRVNESPTIRQYFFHTVVPVFMSADYNALKLRQIYRFSNFSRLLLRKSNLLQLSNFSLAPGQLLPQVRNLYLFFLYLIPELRNRPAILGLNLFL